MIASDVRYYVPGRTGLTFTPNAFRVRDALARGRKRCLNFLSDNWPTLLHQHRHEERDGKLKPRKYASQEAAVTARVSRKRKTWKKGRNESKREVFESFEVGGARHWYGCKALGLTSRADRVFLIARMMSEGWWAKGCDRGLSEIWRCGTSNVRHMSSEASRWVRLSMGERMTLQHAAMAFLDVVAAQALADRDHATALEAARMFAEIADIFPKQEAEYAGQYKNLSDEELERALRAATEELATKKAV